MRHLTLFIVLALFTAAGQASAQPERQKSFERDYARIEKLADRSKWKQLAKSLDRLLTDYRNEPFVFQHQRQIIEYLKESAFHARYPAPKAQDVVEGKVKSWNARTGRIKITWTDSWLDFQREGSVRIFPAKLAGPATIELSGRKHPASDNLSALYMPSRDTLYRIYFGCEADSSHFYPASIQRFVRSSSKVLIKKQNPPVQGNKKFTLKMKISAKSINTYYNNRSYMSAKTGGEWGHWGFQAHEAIEKIVLNGTIEPSWIKGLIDAQQNANRKKFEKDFALKEVVPGWLLKRQPTARIKVDGETPEYPGELTAQDESKLDRIREPENEEDWKRIIEVVEAIPDPFPKAVRLWVKAMARFALRQDQAALELCREVLNEHPDFYRGQVLKARCLERLLREEESLAAWKAAADRHPRQSQPFQSMAVLLMTRNRIKEAEKVLKTASMIGHRDPTTLGLQELIFRARNGPRWARRFTIKSRHYEVHTDIDKATAVEASKVLEKAHTAYAAWMGRGERGGGTGRFQVYVFSGKSGYDAYVKSLFGAPRSHTAGLYMPLLKQLLIWNLPDRKDMLKTVQHEGFHQYIDSITKQFPVWLNEGTAEYYETATSGRWSRTPIRRDHLQVLQRGLKDLKGFIYIQPQDFYKSAERNYAQAWALVYFLRHSTPARKQVLKKLHEKLIGGLPADQALHEVFDALDLNAMKNEMAVFLDKLREQLD